MSEFVYEGAKLLEDLKEAVNYNESLKALVIKNSLKGRCLDFGAGIGTFADLVRKEIDPSCLELDASQASFLEEKGYIVIKNLEKSQFDYIYSLNVLEHIKDDQAALASICEALNEKGRALIFVPAFNLLFSSLDQSVGHYRRYSMSMMREIIPEGYRIKKISYFDTIGFLFALLFKVFKLGSDQVKKSNIKIFDSIFFPINKILDPLFSKFFGKNLYVVIEKI